MSARFGWHSTFSEFVSAEPRCIETSLADFLPGSSPQQVQSWRSSIKWLQREYDYCIKEDSATYSSKTILEYELPRDFRRPDVLVLRSGLVVVLEVKGRVGMAQAARDQVSAYARDLRAYHRACADQIVVPILVPSNGSSEPVLIDDVWVVGPAGVHGLLLKLGAGDDTGPITPGEFLAEDAYAPLPSIVQAARALFEKEELPRIKRARAATDPALKAISDIAHEAARTKSRHLVLLSGVPGAGKTLVGLQLAHAGWLDDLAVERENGKPSLPAVYLSGNGPLVAVLQDALKGKSSPGGVFVQDIKKYIDYFTRRPKVAPPEHLIIFDEAQRAHDAERVASVHKKPVGQSEPEHLIEFCQRIPEWSVLVALIGSGQAIHVGEEGGIALWRDAVARSVENWTVHAASQFETQLTAPNVTPRWNDALNLDTELRFHLTPKIEEFVGGLLDGASKDTLRAVAEGIAKDGHRFFVTRSLETAKSYILQRYEEAPEARYGVLASSKDKILLKHDVDNTFQTTKRLKVGPWYNRPSSDPLSCCNLDTVATEFSSQGLELDFVLLAWGSDLLFERGCWSNRMSRGTMGVVHDPLQLRKNVYRVLLTRGRDGTVVFVPEDPNLDSTYEYLSDVGFRNLDAD